MPTKASLEHPFLQLIRAKEHLESLDAAVSMFHTSEPTSVSVLENTTNGVKALQVKIPVPHARLGLIAGDVFMALRSSLDYLMWQLALQTTENPHRRTQFPVIWRVNGETESRLTEITRDLPPGVVEEVKGLQPHLRGDAYKSDPLWQIDELCNIAKHKVIPVHGASLTFNATISQEDIASTHMERLGEMVVVLTAEGSAKLKLAPQARAGVLFGDSQSGIQINRREIRNLYEYVEQAVFPKFYRFF